jgi:oxidoreductase
MTIRTVLVGLGWSGREIWLPRLLRRDDYTLVAAVDLDPARREAFTAATGQPAVAAIDALGPGSVDLVVVAVPNHAHCSVARDVLLRGLAVFVEKPVCLSADEAILLAEAERQGGALLLAGSAARYRADVAELARQVAEIGTVRDVELAWIRAQGIPQGHGWFTNRSQAGGGVLIDLGWHLLDVLEHIVGPVTFRHVAAAMRGDYVNDPRWAAAWRHDLTARGPQADVEDTMRGFLVADSGMSVGLRVSWASHSVARDTTLIRIEGSTGTATLHCTFGFSPNREPQSRLTIARHGQEREILVTAEPVGAEYDSQLDDLKSRLTGTRSPGDGVAEAHRIVTTIEAIYQAAAGVRADAESLPVDAVVR